MKYLPIHGLPLTLFFITLGLSIVSSQGKCGDEITKVVFVYIDQAAITEADATDIAKHAYLSDGRRKYKIHIELPEGQALNIGAYAKDEGEISNEDTALQVVVNMASTMVSGIMCKRPNTNAACIYAIINKGNKKVIKAIDSSTNQESEKEPSFASFTWSLDKYQCMGLYYASLERHEKLVRQNMINLTASGSQQTCPMVEDPHYTPFYEYPGFPASVPHYLVPFHFGPGRENPPYHLAIWNNGDYAYWKAGPHMYQSYNGRKNKLKMWREDCGKPTVQADPVVVKPGTGGGGGGGGGGGSGGGGGGGGGSFTTGQKGSSDRHIPLSFASVLSISLVSLVFLINMS